MSKKKKAKQTKRQNIASKRATKVKKRQTTPKQKNTSIINPVAVDNTPEFYDSFADVVNYSKNYIYLIARIRQRGKQIQFTTLGTGFLIGPHRFITCAHCVNDPSNKENPLAHHIDGDVYLLVQRDEEGGMHTATIQPKMEKTLFCNPETDSAIMYLPDDFYKFQGNYIRNPMNHLRFSNKPHNIGTDAGVLGYPLQGLRIAPNGQPDIEKIFIRGDKGVVNTRYKRKNNVFMYEFTMAFNPGNSGGPIFDIKSGNVIGMVHAFNSIPLRPVEDTLNRKNGDGTTESTKHTSIIRTTYSLGLASQNFKQYKDEHLIKFGK